MSEEMFQASLQEGQADSTKSYDIQKLFYVAFFGGVISTLVLALKNADWLKVSDRAKKTIIAAGIALVLIKAVIMGVGFNGELSAVSIATARARQGVKWALRGVSLAYFLLVYYLFKDRYQQHLVTVGETEPLFKNAIVWIAVGGTIEAIILFGGVYLVGIFA